MDLKKFLAGICVFVFFIALVGFNAVSAKKSSVVKMPPETIETMANQVDALTRKVYGHALLSPEDNSNLIGIKIKLDNQMLVATSTELAPLYYKAGNIYKLREMKPEAIECYQTILENFSDTALAPKARTALESLGVTVATPTTTTEEDSSGDEGI